ncbi:IS200/IS605 family element RNA-guided endonuclease TnpB [Acetoanaerobium noterae]|uniref:IS200/IS605 family element RNA-guided endonuclease TnpB n=1 Tax=Acetoanaerobium noterae TaxID=745369 RepID=UPI002F41D620
MQNKAYKFRLYPNKQQQELINMTFGCTRFVFNRILGDAIKYYEENKKTKINTPATYKSDYPFLKEVDSLALANAQLQVKVAYKNFYNGSGFPKFRSKKNNYQSYTTNNQKGSVRIESSKIKLPKVGFVKIKLHQAVQGVIKSVTISKNPSGKYYISILTQQEIAQLASIDKKLGIDLGLKNFAITSDGDIFENPKFLRKTEKQLTKAQRELSRKKKGSNNRYKARLKVAKLHEKIANQRKDFLHKLSTKLIRENQTIVMEDLSVKNMMKNHKLAKAISEVSWYQFRLMLDYKSKWYGREIIIAPSNYASSQLCSNCGYKNTDVKDLKIREWKCPSCGSVHDRDINASKNLLKLAM